ncbi:MAG: MFS transporter [Acidothermaceae bacterium]
MTAISPPEQRKAANAEVRHGAVLVVTCIALATVVSAMASLNVALPSLARDTGASQTQLSWVVDAYSLVFAALLLPAGAIGDRFGRRKALLAGLLIFGAASAIATMTTTPYLLIVLRGFLGLGASFVMPATLSTITTTFPRQQRGRAVGTWAAVAGGSAVIGLLATGALLEEWSWRSAFVLNVGLTVVAVVGTLLVVPESADSDAPKLDVVGSLAAVVGLAFLVYSVIEAPENGWLDAITVAGIVAGLLVLAGFVWWELRRVNPLLDPRLFKHPRFAAGTLSISLQFFAFFGFIFVVMQYLQIARRDSALIAALSVTPMAAAMLPSARLAPRLASRIGTRPCCVGGLVLIAIGLGILARSDAATSYWLIVAGLLPLGAGMGLAMTPATTAITDALPPALQGVASAVNDLSREVGGALGIAVLGSVLNAGYRSHLQLTGVTPAVADKARTSIGVAAKLGGNVLQQARSAFISGMHEALVCGSIAAVVAAIAVAVLLQRRAS